MYYVYVLQSLKDKQLYIGYSGSLKQRLASHMKGKNIATKHRRPVKLIYYEAYLENTDAKHRGTFLKSGSGHMFLYKQLRVHFQKTPAEDS